MNNYHVYEAIGRGKNSAVYKGRKKKTIEYYAIKSVDKSQRSKLLQEVKIIHPLDHPNVLKFYAWYETSAHLWLVLEYCVGGDLMSILQQDTHFPEDFLHDLAFDLVKALQYLHSNGIIYCDLKPSNILMDEKGRMKLCDFGLARRLSDIEKSSVAMLPQSKRGTPCYMSPELFQDGGVHSYASDFWALGCVLYECYTGRPPFVGNQFTQLVKSILYDPIPPIPDSSTSSFVDLINCLLVKDPGERLQWPEICEHAFWRTKFTSVSLPPQPAFENMLQLFVKPHLSEKNGDRPSLPRTPSKGRENFIGVFKTDENTTGNKGFITPVKNAYSGRKVPTKPSGRGDDKHKEAGNASKPVNLVRLSRIAKSNLQRATEKENYRRPLPKTCDNDAEVKIENNDMELDFSESPDDDSPDESESLPRTPLETPVKARERTAEIEHDINQSDIPPDNVDAAAVDLKKLDLEPFLEHIEAAVTPPSSNFKRKAHNVRATSENIPDSDASRPSDNIAEVFWHLSDLSVKPVMPSRKGDKASDGIPPLPFDAVPVSDYLKLLPEQLTALNSRIIHSLSGGSQVSEKQNTIRYLEILSGNADAATIVTNGPIMLLLVKMFRLSKASVIRVQLATVIGLLIRRSTFIQVDLASSGVVNALADGLRDKQDRVRRYSMAALGELLFYISTQTDNNAKDVNILESPSKDHRSSGWQVPSSVIALVSSLLRKGEDDVAQLYALRSIENVCSQGCDWTSRFASQDVIGNLCYIYRATGKQESTRLTAGSCLVRLARFSPACVQSVIEKLSLKDAASALTKGSPREQQISLNLLNMAILSSHLFPNMGRHLLSLLEEKHLVPGLISFIEQGSEVLRGKSLILVALLCKNSRRWIPHFLSSAKLFSVVDRLVKEKDVFVHQCMEAFVQLVASTVPNILETVSGDIQQQMMGVKRPATTSALAGRGNTKSTSYLFPVVLHLLGSTSFKHRVVTRQVLQQLANMIKLLEAPFQGRDDFQMTALRVLETVTEDPSVILDDPKIFTSRFLPNLAILYKSNKDADARFLCLKIMFDVVVVIFSDIPETSLREAGIANDLESVSQAHFLPLYPAFTEDEDPIPMYAQKLLIILIEFRYVKVSDILDPKIVSQCFQFLLGDLSSATVNNVKLCLELASAPEMETKVLSDLRVVRKIGNLLEFVMTKEMDDFLEPTLDLCKAFILRGIGSNRGITIAKEPALLGGNLAAVSDQQYSVKDITDFASNFGAFLELVGSSLVKIAELASECVILLMKAAPREATMSLLKKLTKIGCLLESLLHDGRVLPLLRVLYSLAFSCRQYLSHGMILSLPIPAVRRIETIVSALKKSSVSGVAEAALSLDLELQRLPRCA